MRALAKTTAGPGLDLVDRPAPTPGPGEVLLRVEAASICGTDLHLFTWDEWASENLVPPRILGHEIAGTVVATGSGVRRVREGDLVGVESHIVDWTCAQCRARPVPPVPQPAGHRRAHRWRVRRAGRHPGDECHRVERPRPGRRRAPGADGQRRARRLRGADRGALGAGHRLRPDRPVRGRDRPGRGRGAGHRHRHRAVPSRARRPAWAPIWRSTRAIRARSARSSRPRAGRAWTSSSR